MLRRSLVIALVLLFPLTLRAESSPVGVVSGISGTAQAVRVVRGQESFLPEVGMVIFQGDKITVTASDTTVTVDLNGRTDQLTVTKDNAQKQGIISVKAEQASVISNIMRWLAGMGAHKRSQTVMLATRGQAPAIVVPIFRPNAQAVAAGPQDWPLIWSGGAAPYGVRLLGSSDAAVLIQKAGLTQPAVVLEGVNPTPGEYVLEVQGGGRKAVQPLVVVARSALPGMPKEISEMTATDELKALLFIAWLSRQDNGKWGFEAMLQANRLSQAYPPAGLLLRSLQESAPAE